MTKPLQLRDPSGSLKFYYLGSTGYLESYDLGPSQDNRRPLETIFLNYHEIERILKIKNQKGQYEECDKLFNQKFPQPKEKKKELSKEEQSKLEKLFP